METSLRSVSDAYGDQIEVLTAEVSNLRAAIRSEALTDTSEILLAANAIEAKLDVWAATLPTSWAYRVIRLPKNSDVVPTVWGEIHPYDCCYHIYPHLQITNGWCWYRVSRILINEVIIDCLRRLFEERATLSDLIDRFRNIRGTMRQLAADICASVPYLFGILGGRQRQMERGTCIGGYMLLLPLFTAGSVDGPTHPLRQWTIESFQVIAHTMGIGHAFADIDILRNQKGIVQWMDDLDREFNLASLAN
jgi:hypothetical protein